MELDEVSWRRSHSDFPHAAEAGAHLARLEGAERFDIMPPPVTTDAAINAARRNVALNAWVARPGRIAVGAPVTLIDSFDEAAPPRLGRFAR